MLRNVLPAGCDFADATFAVALVHLALALTGCRGNGEDLVGNWKGTVPASSASTNSAVSGPINALAGAFTLDLKADLTFYDEHILSFEEDWAVEGTEPTLAPTKAMGAAVSESHATPIENSLSVRTEDSDRCGPKEPNGWRAIRARQARIVTGSSEVH